MLSLLPTIFSYPTSTNLWDEEFKEFASLFQDYELYSDEKAHHLEIPLIGYSKDELNIEVKNQFLTIKAEREKNKEEKGLRRQLRHSYQRSFSLPDNCLIENIDAELKDGILKIDIPKEQEQKKHKKIEIK